MMDCWWFGFRMELQIVMLERRCILKFPMTNRTEKTLRL